MNSSEHDPPLTPDDELRRALQSLPIPETPSDLESRARGRILRRRVRRTALATGVGVLLVGLLVWQPWADDAAPVVPRQPGPVAQTQPQISPDELDVLFAPPPVDSLAVLARRDEVSVGALNRLEGVK